jgi:N-acyl-D-aspartate/D-glutamate deacylase
MFCDAWSEIGLLTLAEQIAAMRRPEVKDRFVAEMSRLGEPVTTFMSPDRMFPLGDPPDYEPAPERSVAALAARAGQDVWSFLYDQLLVDDGRELLNSPILNYAQGDLQPTYEMLSSPVTAFGLGDGGAHAGQTCDASSTTFLLTHWARDRTRGPRLTLEQAVAKMTGRTAALYGLGDRGVVAPGRVADLNLIDFERLRLARPELVFDLPGGARRLIQRAEGYVATIKSGVETFREGEETGERPGSLLRGPR